MKQEELVKKAPPLSRIEEFSHAAHDYVKRSLGLPLDESEESLAFVDHYIRNLHKQGLPKPEIIDLIASALGVYFGQVVLSKVNGRWVSLLSKEVLFQEDPRYFMVELSEIPLSFSPFAMVLESIHHTENKDFDSSFHVPTELSEMLHQIFDKLAPVNVDYYFSLTGRMETLLYVVEILAHQIQNKKAELQTKKS